MPTSSFMSIKIPHDDWPANPASQLSHQPEAQAKVNLLSSSHKPEAQAKVEALPSLALQASMTGASMRNSCGDSTPGLLLPKPSHWLDRRAFLGDLSQGVGGIALAALFAEQGVLQAGDGAQA